MGFAAVWFLAFLERDLVTIWHWLPKSEILNAVAIVAGAAVFATQQRVAAPVFQTYVTQLRLDTDYRGGDGIGWAMRVDKSDIAMVQSEMRRSSRCQSANAAARSL